LNKLVEEIIKPILEANGIKKVIGIYGGRFQPFGPHHLKTYKWLQSKVDEAYITTSNIKKPPRHPMNFKEKVRHMTKMGVKSKYIIEEKSPYNAKNLAKKYDKDTTAFVYVFGAKDAGRLGGGGKYFQDYLKNKKNLKGYGENGYYLVAPHVSISVGGKEVSGTTMRELLGSDKFDDKQRAKLFKKMFGYYDKGVFNMMTNKFSKIFENDIIHTTWDNTKPKPKNPKLFDKKKRDLLFDIEFKKALKKLKVPNKILTNKNQLVRYLTSNPQMLTQLIRLATEDVNENIKLPIKVGDTIMMGRFKNKKVVVKTIDFNDKGDLMINGRPALKFRIVKNGVEEKVVKTKDGYRKYIAPKDSDFKEPYKQGYIEEIYMGYPDKKQLKKHLAKLIKIRSKLGSNQKYQYHPIDESSNTNNAGGVQGVDSGPSLMFKNSNDYKGRGNQEAEKLGWSVIDYILKNDADDLPPNSYEMLDGWPIGGHNSVSYLPAGIGTGKTPNNQENLTGTKGYNKWFRAMRTKAEEVGYELIKFTKQERDIKKQIAKDTVDTIKQQKEEEKEKEVDIKVEENIFTKEWWDDVLVEVSAKTKKFKQKLMRRGIKIRYDKAKAQQDLQQKYGGQGEVVGKKFGLRKAYYAVPKKGFKKDTKPTLKFTKKEIDKLQKDKVLDKGNLKVVFSESWWKENLLTEGGAYGHMAHPFDDKELTFGDLKKIIELGLGGQLNREDNVTEKLDGQNIMVSFKDGKLIAARNKGHIKNGGKTALDTKGIISKFKGRGDIKDAFVFAMKDLEKAIKSLSDKQKEKIFNNGYNFMNLEVMWPASANVINYDKAELVFHGALIYDNKGNVKGEVKGSGRVLAGMIKQRNQNIQKKYKIGKPVFLDVPKHQDFGTMKSKFIGELNKLRNQYGLKDNDTLGLYHQSYWEEYIYNAAQQFNYDITDDILENLTKRWAFFDKSYKIPTIKKELKDEPIFLEWVLKTDKENHKKMVKENMKPFETLFFEVGAEILKNVKGFMAANPNKSVQNIRKKLNTSIENVIASGDKKKLNTLKLQLDKLNKIGGVDAIVPSEGIVFKYKGKTYKFTGAFAPINQITGLIYF
jgi:hypothetical protein